MDKLKMHTPNKADQNWGKLVELFPNAVTETINENGAVVRAIDKDILMQEINTSVVEGREERYQFTWPDKKKSILLANAPISKTLRPVREESVNFDSTENLYIEGDNLDVLKLLQETYLGKVKMIYIDPPYNTGNDFVYEDDFAQSTGDYLEQSGQYDEAGNRLFRNLDTNGRFHTDWLNMMYPRLKVAKDLLSDDGVIFISIDDNEQDNLKKMCDEIFGSSNYFGCVTRATGTTTGQDSNKIGSSLDYLLIYKRTSSFTLEGIELSEDDEKRFSYEDNKGKYSLLQLRKTGNADRREDRPNMYYPLISPDGREVYPIGPTGYESRWRFGYSTYEKYLENDMIVWRTSRNAELLPYVKYYLEGRTKQVSNLWLDIDGNKKGTIDLKSAIGSKSFDNPKPVDLIIRVLKISGVNDNDIVLDFFSGSATTAHAIMKLNSEDEGNRKFIMVQLPEETNEKSEAYKAGYKNICEIGKERIRQAGNKIKEESPLTTQDLDVGFRVLKVDSSNMKDVYYSPDEYDVNLFDSLTNNIKEDRTGEDLLFQVMLDLGVLLSSKIDESIIADKKVFNVEDGYLIACFDEDVTDETIKAIAQMKPYYFVMRDSSLANDSVATNFEQIFATYSPDTIRKVI